MPKYHKLIYDKKKKIILHNYDQAYREDKNTWSSQDRMDMMPYSYLLGLLQSKTIMKRFKKTKTKNAFLDIGCGFGDFVDYLNYNTEYDGFGFDISKFAIAKGKKKFGNKIKLQQCDIRNGIPYYKKKFNIIFMNGTLWYYLKECKKIFKDIKNHMAVKGILTISITMHKNPIGKEIIANGKDFKKIVKKDFKIINELCWVESSYLNGEIIQNTTPNHLLLCEKK